MKRLALWITLLTLAFLLTGCGAQETASVESVSLDVSDSPVTSAESSFTETASEPTSSAISSASTPVSASSLTASSSTPILVSSAGADVSSRRQPANATSSPVSSAVEQPDAKIQVTLSVNCSAAVKAGNSVALQLAPDGWLLPETRFSVEPGATVYDLLKQSGLVVAAQDSMFGKYVYSIQSLAEKACGGQSGWVFTVDGNTQNQSSSKTVLSDGARVEWNYTIDGKTDSQ